MNTFEKTLIAFVSGAAAGIITGILIAPAKGSTTRRKIARKSQYVTDQVKDKFEDFKDSVEEILEEIEETAGNKAKRVFRH